MNPLARPWESGIHGGEHASWWQEPRQWRVIRFADGTFREADWLRPWSEWEWSERKPDPHPELGGSEWLDTVRAERREAMENEERARWAGIETRVSAGGGTSDERAAVQLDRIVQAGGCAMTASTAYVAATVRYRLAAPQLAWADRDSGYGPFHASWVIWEAEKFVSQGQVLARTRVRLSSDPEGRHGRTLDLRDGIPTWVPRPPYDWGAAVDLTDVEARRG